MAPNRRRKPGLMRIDAALAAMRPMGFPDSMVRKHVRQLLKVYGEEEDGWYFIEETSYKLLIDTLLEGQCASNLLTHGSAEPESKPLVLSEAAGRRGANRASSSGGSQTLLPLPVKQEPVKIEENKQDDPVAQPGTQEPKRKPCYGWISDGDDDESDYNDGDFLFFPPANGEWR